MPKLILDIEDIYKTINRPIILQVTKDIIDLTDFPEDCDVYFKGFSKQIVNKESVMADKDREGIKFSHNNRVIVTAEMKYSEHTVYAGQPYFKSFRPIFYNSDYEILLSPVNHQVEVALTFNFISKSRQIIEQWRSDIRRKIGRSVMAYPHGVTYTYPVNEKFVEILNHLFEKKIIFDNEEENFEQWFGNNSYEKVTLLTNQIGKCPTLSVEQHQLGVFGSWEFSEVPEIEKLETGDLYQSTLNYLLRYSQPTSITLEYPVIIANSVIGADYRPPCDYNVPLVLGDPEKLVWGLNATRKSYQEFYPSEPLRLPCFDEWIPTNIPRSVSRLYSALITVDTNNPTYVMDLVELGEEYALAPWLIEAMKKYKNDLLILGKSPILVLLYRNDVFFEGELLFIDEDLKLYTNQPMDYRNQYHVTLNLYTDLSLLSENAISTLRKDGETCVNIIKTLAPELVDKDLEDTDNEHIPPILSDGSVGKLDFWNTISQMQNTHDQYKSSTENRLLTVGSCLITTRRTDDASS